MKHGSVGKGALLFIIQPLTLSGVILTEGVEGAKNEPMQSSLSCCFDRIVILNAVRRDDIVPEGFRSG